MGLFKVKKSEKRKKVAHILAGFVIGIHAFEKWESHHGPWLFFALSAVLFLSLAVFHHRLAHKFPWIDGSFFIIEAILSFYIAYEYFELGKKAIPYCYVFAGLAQLVVAFIHSRKGMRHQNATSA